MQRKHKEEHRYRDEKGKRKTQRMQEKELSPNGSGAIQSTKQGHGRCRRHKQEMNAYAEFRARSHTSRAIDTEAHIPVNGQAAIVLIGMMLKSKQLLDLPQVVAMVSAIQHASKRTLLLNRGTNRSIYMSDNEYVPVKEDDKQNCMMTNVRTRFGEDSLCISSDDHSLFDFRGTRQCKGWIPATKRK